MASNQQVNRWSLPGYRSVRVLGSGASGEVVHAIDERTGTQVAIKYLSERCRADPELLRRFREEARLLEGLESPYVTRLYQYREDRDGAAIVMELVEGPTLTTLLREQGGGASPEAALCILKGSLLGLSAAHTAGVVHRDYKPSNVLVTSDGESKLVDFGIAVWQGTEAKAAGTPAYMAPEQWRGEPASPATDVYAATVTFFECLTGDKPYHGDSLPELAVQHLSSPVPENRVPERLRTLVRQGLAKSAAQRPPDADSFLRSVETAACAGYGERWEERGKRALAAMLALLPLAWPTADSAGGDTSAATTVQPLPKKWRGAGRRPGRGLAQYKTWTVAAAGIAVVTLLGGLLTATAGSGGRDHSSASTGPSKSGSPTSAPSTSSRAHRPAGAPPPPPSRTSGEPSGAQSPSSTGQERTGGTPSGSSSSDVGSVGTQGGGTGPTSDPGTTSPSSDGSPSAPPPSSPDPTPTGGGNGESPSSDGSPSAPPPSSPDPTPTGGGNGESETPQKSPAKVTFLGVIGLSADGNRQAQATISVDTNGTGPVTLTVSWYDTSIDGTAESPGVQEGDVTTLSLQGRTHYIVTTSHVFDQWYCTSYWGALAKVDTAAESSRPYRITPALVCEVTRS
ncbi:serine/threonine-protein kinase [Streptomyces sp. NPDC002659]|uniref:serine/threonine-protein kinase n=1 Tax=Streptomyces sp. NPDC002659 TaxID=3364656 RepID=UPI003679488E